MNVNMGFVYYCARSLLLSLYLCYTFHLSAFLVHLLVYLRDILSFFHALLSLYHHISQHFYYSCLFVQLETLF